MNKIERLKVDRKYWNEVAPEGATHYQPQQQMFYKRNGKDSWRVYSNRWWKSPATSDSALWVKRPEQWIDGLPPVGVECEYLTAPREGQGNFAPVWENCVVKYASENGAFLLDKNRDEIFMDSTDYDIRFRPIRTPEQRERQSVIEQAFSKLSEFHDADQVLGDLYDAGMLHKQED